MHCRVSGVLGLLDSLSVRGCACLNGGVIEFGDVTVHQGRRELHKAGEEIHLEPQAFDLLCYLIANHERVVSKEELLDEVWGDQFVSESALTTRVKEVRRAVGDDGRTQAVVKNTRGRGYRFVADFMERPDGAPGSPMPQDGHPRIRVRADNDFPPRRHTVGRSQVLDVIRRSLAPGSLVTLIGPGGVGKTTLALEAAHLHSGSARRAFVDLASIADIDAVVPAFRQALGLMAPNSTDTTGVLAAMGDIEALLVVDNCEHVIDQVAAVLQRMRTTGGRLCVLATSRERLGIPGEQAVPVDPMDIDDARALFAARVQAIDPTLDVAAEDPAAVDALLRDLDHLPLAIEMAAGRMSALGIADLHALVDRRLELLRSADRTVSDRHRTLSELVAWSEELLTPEEGRLFVDMSSFAGPVCIDDVVGVLEPTDTDRFDVVDRLGSLVDKSLVAAALSSEPVTYRMLDTVKAQARSRLGADAERAHAEWFTTIAERADQDLRTDGELQAHLRITDVAAELRQAHTWARRHDHDLASRLTAALATYAFSRFWSEPAEWALQLSEVMSLSMEGAPAVWAALAQDATLRSDYSGAERFARLALAGDDPAAHLGAYDTLTDLALYNGDIASALDLTDRTLALGWELEDSHGVVLGLVGGVLARTYADDPEGAMAHLEQATVPAMVSP